MIDRQSAHVRAFCIRYFCVVAAVCVLNVLTGCVVKEVTGNFTNTVKGDYYLSTGSPEAGEAYFRREIGENPENALNNYYYGRVLLRSQRPKSALPYLKKAATLAPENGDYLFWTGVAYGSLEPGKERVFYQQALQLDPEHQQALTALGHSYMRSRQYAKALLMYDKALSLWAKNPGALYNRALALSMLGRRAEEKNAWNRYLAANSSGQLARNAVAHLNTLGDFSYRNYILGTRLVSVKAIAFDTSGTEVARASHSSLKIIGETAAGMASGVLQVVVYYKGHTDLAKVRALNIRRQLLKSAPELGPERIGVSWLGESQRNRKKKWNIEESVDFFLINK